jgi:8-oxo-dGTP diphosphatase
MKEVAVGIIMNGSRVLACQRKRTAAYPLKWEFPGGKLEPGELPERALARELWEELSIKPEISTPLHCQEWIYPESNGRESSFRVFYYIVPSFTGELANRAFEQIQWVTVAVLQEMDILEGNRTAVDLLAKYVEQREEA